MRSLHAASPVTTVEPTEDGYLLEVRPWLQPARQAEVRGVVEVGRSCEVAFSDPEVSRRHLRFAAVDGTVFVTDLGSRNGTAVNGEAIHETVALRPGDVVGLGRSELVLLRGPMRFPLEPVGLIPAPVEVRAPAPPNPGDLAVVVRDRPALDELATRETEAATFRYRPGTAGEAALADVMPAVSRARKALAGLGSEAWGVRPQICLVDPYPDADDGVVADGSVIDPPGGAIWMVVTDNTGPEPPGRALAMFFGSPLPAAADLAVLVEGYGVAVTDPTNHHPELARQPLPPLPLATGELRTRMAASFVRYLLDRGGRDTFLRMLSTAMPGRVDEAAMQAYGAGLAALEESWRRTLGRGRALGTAQFLRTAATYLRFNLVREAELAAYLLLQLSFSAVFPFAFRRLLNSALPHHDVTGALQVITLLGALFAVSLLAGLRAGYLSSYISAAVVRRIRVDMFQRLQDVSLRWFADQQHGDVLSRLANDVAVFEAGMSQALREGSFQLLSLLTAVVVLMLLSPVLGLLVAAGAALVGVTYRVMAPRMQRRSSEVQEEFGGLLSVASENLAAHLAVRVFGLERHEQARFRRATDRLFARQLRLGFFGAVFTTSVNSIVTALQLGVLAAGGVLVLRGQLTIGTFVVVMSQIGQVIAPVSALSAVGRQIQQSSGALQRINEVRTSQPEICNRPDVVPLPPMTGELRFRDVHFSYVPEQTTLARLDLAIPSGARVAFVGPTGAGKSALLKLLLRLYDVDRGAILLDGVDIRQVPVEELRRQFGVVMQDTFLFDASIRENLALRTPLTDEEIHAAARAAQIHDFIAGLPAGYDSRVGEAGVRLSGGQRQRLAIARALLRKPRVLVLDEATSALDPVTERRILDAVHDAAAGRTTIAVTHRLASVTGYERIFVLDNGQLVEQGRHRELLAAGGLYARMWAQQTAKQEQATPELSIADLVG